MKNLLAFLQNSFTRLFPPKKPSKIVAKVHSGILQKADRLFRNDDAGMWTELLQNARRAGSTAVLVSMKENESAPISTMITVLDDGRGIEDFQKLLTLGASGWPEATQTAEDPAGMGFFSLCHSTVEVHSGNELVSIDPDVFLGKKSAKVETSSEHVPGTQVRFHRDSRIEVLITALEKVSRFCPLRVFLNGRELPQQDFLAGALVREAIDGIEVGWAIKFEHEFSRHHDDNWNFYGARIEHAVKPIPGFLPAFNVSPSDLNVRFNVLETGHIHLQLPDRRSIIEDGFLATFLKEARGFAYRYIGSQEHHVLPYSSWKEAQELGINLKEASCLLATWHADPCDTALDPLFGRSTDCLLQSCDGAFLVSQDLPNLHTFEAALQTGAIMPGPLYQEDSRYVGYGWYAKLPMVVDVEVLLDGISYENAKATEDRPGHITLEVTVATQPQEFHKIFLPALVHVESGPGECNFVAVKGSPWDNDNLDGPFSILEFLIWATFSASDDWVEADSWQTQFDAYEEDIQRQVNAYFRGPRATLIAILREALDWQAKRLAEELDIAELRFVRAGRDWDIELIRAEPTAQPKST